MPFEAILLDQLPSPLAKCPNCGAEPFEPFLRGQVVRSALFAPIEWFRAIRAGKRFARWCLICRECKSIVGFEAV